MSGRIIVFLAFCALLLGSCEKEGETGTGGGTEAAVEILTDDVTLGSAVNERQTVEFTSTVDWTASIENTKAPSWCEISPASGKAGVAKLSVWTIKANEKYEDRKAVITIKAGSVEKTVTVTQKKMGALILSEDVFNVLSAGKTIDVEVQQNVDYSVVISEKDALWIEPVSSKALVTDRLQFRILPNDGDKRSGFITLKDKNSSLSARVTVNQGSRFIPTVTDGWDIYDGGLYRYGPSIIINDDGSIDAWFAAPGGRYGENVSLFKNTGNNTAYNIGDGKTSVGQKFTTDTPFYTAGAICVNWSGNKCGLRLSLYSWKGDYAKTVASTPVARKTFVDYEDGSYVCVGTGSAIAAGTYLWVMDEGATEHSGLWKHPTGVAGVTTYVNGSEVDYSFSGQYALTISEGSAFWDQASYQHSTNGGKTWSAEKMVLLPTEFSSDHFSVCDPGVARWGGYYYIGYTSTENPGMVENHVYIARGKTPEGPWEKWNGSGWTTGTDVQPMIRYTDDPAMFGAGEPSIVVLDGTIYFYYSWNGTGSETTTTRLATADASDPLWPAHLTLHGTVINKSSIGGADHSDVKYREDIGKFQAVHTAARMGPGSYIVLWQSDDGIHFEKIAELREGLQTYLHNCGWSGDEQGHMKAGVQQYISYAYGSPTAQWGNWKTRWSKLNF